MKAFLYRNLYATGFLSETSILDANFGPKNGKKCISLKKVGIKKSRRSLTPIIYFFNFFKFLLPAEIFAFCHSWAKNLCPKYWFLREILLHLTFYI